MATTIAVIIGLFIFALLLLLFELLTPSFGVMTAMAVAAVAVGVWRCFMLDTWLGVGAVVAWVILGPAYFMMLVRWLPETAAGRALFLQRTGNDTAAGTPEAEENKALVGKTGIAETELRPSGAVRIEGRREIGIAESGVIARGAAVKVIRLSGSDLVVRPVEPA